MSTPKALLAAISRAAHPTRGDRGMLAALRRGLNPATAQLAWPHIAPYCDLADSRQRTLWLTFAGGAALLASEGLVRPNAGNLGATMRKLARGDGSQRMSEALQSFENRFRRLLSCQDIEELCAHLPTVFRAAAAKSIPIDMEQLFWDILKWEDTAEPTIKVLWAKVYWMGERNQAPTTETAGEEASA